MKSIFKFLFALCFLMNSLVFATAKYCYYDLVDSYVCEEETQNPVTIDFNINTNSPSGMSVGCNSCAAPRPAETVKSSEIENNVKPYSGLKTCNDGREIWEWEYCKPTAAVDTVITPVYKEYKERGEDIITSVPVFSGSVVYTSGYNNYGITATNPNLYQTSSWGSVSPPQYYTNTQTYNTVTQNNNNQIPYVPTNWGTANGATQNYTLTQTYANTPSAPTPPTVVSTPYVPTVWGVVSGSPQSYTNTQVYNNTNNSGSNTNTNTNTNTNSAPYVPTNWNVGVNNAPQTYTNSQVYNNTNNSNQNNNTNSVPYVPTNWNVGTNNAPQRYTNTQVYNNVNTQSQSNSQTGTGANNQNFVATNWGINTFSGYSGSNVQTYTDVPLGCNNNCATVYASKVLTSAISELTDSSVRCNGVATISGNESSLGYIEYGETRDLGRASLRANLGSMPSVSFSNTITNLSPGTTYYCRAVMSNAKGVYRGNIVSFTTKGKSAVNSTVSVSSLLRTTTVVRKEEVVTRVPVETVVNNKKVTVSKTEKQVIDKKVVICKDENGNTEDLSEGKKFVTIDIRKPSNIYAGQKVTYTVHLYNNSKIDLKQAYIKLSKPQEFQYLGTPSHMVEGDLVLSIGDIKAGENIQREFDFLIDSNAKVGSGIVSSAYVYYEMLGADGKTISDENSSYIVANLESADTLKEGDTFLKSGIFKWLIVLILFFVLFILGRNIYKAALHNKYKKKIQAAHH